MQFKIQKRKRKEEKGGKKRNNDKIVCVCVYI